jgi:hypothetical protein
MNVRAWRWGFAVMTLAVAAGCFKKKGQAADASADATAEADAAAAAAPTAANANEVARFGDETRVDNEAAKLEIPAAPRKSPPLGEIVAPLKKGTDVTKVAKHEGFSLVTFANPKNASETLMGWVPDSAFAKPPPLPAHCKSNADCPKPQACVNVGGSAGHKCEVVCAGEGDDKACPSGQVCRGEGAIGDAFQPFCIAAPKKDGGADTGAPSAAAGDAGGAPRRILNVVQADGGK